MAVIAAPIIRIRPARWYAHADGLVELGALVAARARALECAHDARAPFALAYKRYITAMWEEVEDSRFGDATAWIARLTVEHANGWLRAMDSYDRGEYALVPGTWRGLFARQRHGRTVEDEAAVVLDVQYERVDLRALRHVDELPHLLPERRPPVDVQPAHGVRRRHERDRGRGVARRDVAPRAAGATPAGRVARRGAGRLRFGALGAGRERAGERDGEGDGGETVHHAWMLSTGHASAPRVVCSARRRACAA